MLSGKFINKSYSYKNMADDLSKKNNNRILGAGVTSIVYRLTGDRVVKLGHCGPYDISTGIQRASSFGDDPYLNFVEVAKKSNNKYFPKIFEINLFEDKEDGRYFYTVMTELLHPMNFSNPHMLDQYRDIAVAPFLLRELPEDNPQLEFALTSLWRLQERFTDDIHQDNVMFRGIEHPSLVFIDPIC
jgi:hypothetical protein